MLASNACVDGDSIACKAIEAIKSDGLAAVATAEDKVRQAKAAEEDRRKVVAEEQAKREQVAAERKRDQSARDAEEGRKFMAQRQKFTDMGCVELGDVHIAQKLDQYLYEIKVPAGMSRRPVSCEDRGDGGCWNPRYGVEYESAILRTTTREFKSTGATGTVLVKRAGKTTVTSKDGFAVTVTAYTESAECLEAYRAMMTAH